MRRTNLILAALPLASILACTADGAREADERSTDRVMQRAATIIGAHAKDFGEADATIGPLQNQRTFHPGALPASFVKAADSRLPAGVVAVVSYKTPDTHVVDYVTSIPEDRPVVMIYHHEPEEEYGGRGAKFVAEFVAQSQLIRSVGKPNVKVAMAAMTYQYDKNRNGVGCDYIPPPSSVDFYLADNYEDTPNGKGLADDSEWLGWVSCVQGKGKPLGLAEYGLGTGGGNAKRAATIRRDNDYLKATFPDFVMWSYWWVDKGGIEDYKFTDSATVKAWKDVAAGR